MKRSPAAGAALALGVAVSGLFATTVGPATVAPATASVQGLLDDAALSGVFTGGRLPAGTLHVSIKEGDWRELPEGGSFELYPVPADGVHISGDTWWVSLDPASVPAKFVASDGQVDFMIEGHDPASGDAVFHTVSAQRVTSLAGDLTRWVRADAPIQDGWMSLPGLPSTQPMNTAAAPTVPVFGGADAGSDNLEADMNTSTVIPDTGELTGIPLELIKSPTGSVADDGGSTDYGSLLPTPDSLASVDTAAAAPYNCQEISGYRGDLQTTIATGYPSGATSPASPTPRP